MAEPRRIDEDEIITGEERTPLDVAERRPPVS